MSTKRSFLKLKDVAEQLKVSPATVRKYALDGRINFTRNPGNQRVFTQKDVDDFLGVKPANRTKIFYVRASDGDEIKLNNQITQLVTSFGEPDLVYKDKASGLNENRPGLNKVLNENNAIVYVTNKDRLTRFGFGYIEKLLAHNNSTIEVLDDAEKTLQEELMQDFMSLIASFSGKFYRIRGWEQQRKLLVKAGEIVQEKEHSNQ